MKTETSVLIVGGSLNGLSMAVFLAAQGVRCRVVERHRDTTVQYKFAGISPRTMEIYRAFGLEDAIRANRTGDQKSGEIASARTLADAEVHFMGKPWADTEDLSAATAETCDQERLEPLLRDYAQRLGATITFETEFGSFEQDERGVTALLRDVGTGREEIATASYMIAADGAGGRIREALGIGRHGTGALQHWMNLIFETDLQPVLQGRKFTSCFVTDINGSFTPRDDRWLLAVQYDADNGERPEDFDAARVRDLVRRGAGDDHVQADLADARSWEVAALVADRFREGRCFLVGDAAHLMPPTGGFGGNTGIHDAHNLAWKLAAVLSGQADVALLDTYDEERRPIAERTLAQAMARLSAWFRDPSRKLPEPEAIVDDYAVIFGQVYGSGALTGGSGSSGFEDPRSPTGRPGTRAPHVVLRSDGTPIHDLVVEGPPLLLLGGEGESWAEAVAEISRTVELTAISFASFRTFDGVRNAQDAFGVGDDGAVLVRPDGIVAWRASGKHDDAPAELRKAFAALSMPTVHASMAPGRRADSRIPG